MQEHKDAQYIGQDNYLSYNCHINNRMVISTARGLDSAGYNKNQCHLISNCGVFVCKV